MKNRLELFPIFNCLETSDKEKAESLVRTHVFEKGEFVHFEGDHCDSLEMIAGGCVQIEQLDIDGNVKTIQEYKTGDYFGLNFLYSSNEYYLMNVISTADTKIMSLNKSVITEYIDKNVHFRYEFIKLISDNTRRMGMRMKTDFRLSLRDKILNYVREQSIIQESNYVLFHTSKTNLSREFGVERTSLSRELKKMKLLQMIEYDRKGIRLIGK